MIRLNTKRLNIKGTDGTFENIATVGLTVDQKVDENSENPISNSAVAKLLSTKFDEKSVATDDEIDSLFD